MFTHPLFYFFLNIFKNVIFISTYTIDLLFKLLIFLFFLRFICDYFEQYCLDCYISKAGYYDLFQIINSKFVIFNYKEYNCRNK